MHKRLPFKNRNLLATHPLHMLQVGDSAPLNISLESSNGETHSLSDFDGKKIILYFYPKDDTPGCTKEACEFRDTHEDFSQLNAVIIGVSKDPLKSHEKFINKYELPFLLLSDPDKKLHEACGTWVEKSMYGRKYMGSQRSTFLIDEKGIVQEVWPKVKVTGHVKAVLTRLSEM
jgi:peroxiredoxin Q/BCP